MSLNKKNLDKQTNILSKKALSILLAGFVLIAILSSTAALANDMDVEKELNVDQEIIFAEDYMFEPVLGAPLPDFLVPFSRLDHEAYLLGFPDGTIRPNGKVTRAEAATILFRLLTDEYRLQIWSQDNTFSDVDSNYWFNNAVSTLANANLIEGFSDGTFRGHQEITRAEFAAIITRFIKNIEYPGVDIFTDIEGHWARNAINLMGFFQWIVGFEDGSFGPEKSITRAEVAVFLNRMLKRHPGSVEDLLPDMIIWPDNMNQNSWYYLDIQEATNSHNFLMKNALHEQWTEIREPRDWTIFERPNYIP